jgi:hypothetical protein
MEILKKNLLKNNIIYVIIIMSVNIIPLPIPRDNITINKIEDIVESLAYITANIIDVIEPNDDKVITQIILKGMNKIQQITKSIIDKINMNNKIKRKLLK